MDGFEVSRAPEGLEVFLAPKLRYIDEAGRETERFLAENGAGIDAFGVLLIMREALTNAVLYGSRHEEDSRIRYSLRLDPGGLTMEVEDDGDGFDWKSQTADIPDITSESGRGTAIMTLYSSGFQYNEKGNRLAVYWKRD
ncbi:MAG: ATP-binding protein [Pseudomonadota bacterium]|jgi:serine/threonine-protein kinase RsbW|nr:ATP-binding protein [Syntrophaceae bacterium]MBP7033665.1 ATP-binding protein [Syntrophobacterales bacterium]MDI9556177.1 ATP-binding protein [Pseudomonadota bacterium]NLX32598.1 ATP-binding protein [Deltaproteobacteria bacterium]HNU85094.1 ATP-binding protein [Syntrophales bacterium]